MISIIKKIFNRTSKETDEDNPLDSETLTELNHVEKDMIKGIVELSETSVKEIMVPRIDVVFLSENIEKEELYKKIIDSGHSRFPVYHETIDNISGILYAKDLLGKQINNSDFTILEVMRKAYFVPESMKLDCLLKELKQRKVHIAIAVDEYGGVSGIVCFEDIIEEIVGDIQDEFDNEEDDIIPLGNLAFLCDARVNIENLNDELSLTLPFEDFDTLGGFVFDLFGKIPVRFEKVSYQNTDFIIQSVDGHKIKSVKIVKNSKDEET